jgi:acyl carrier protein
MRVLAPRNFPVMFPHLARHLLHPTGNTTTPRTVGTASMQDAIRTILARSGRLAVPVESLGEEADLFAAGLDSLAIVNVLMSIEEQFDIELPDEFLSRRSFSSIATIRKVVADLTENSSGR